MRTPSLALFSSLLCLSLFTLGCADDGDESLDAETGDTTGDGDGDPASGDGDGDDPTTTTGDGDGDDPTTTGDGDGDDPTTTGDGDGDDPTTTGDGDCDVVMISTNMGDMVVSLDSANAPITVANFKAYVDEGFYADTIFHRVIDTFMIQGGGFTSGMIPKMTMPPIVLETDPALPHVNGAISMARTNEPDTATSQFFICDGQQDFLNGQYAAFGVVTEGLDVLASISAVSTGMSGQFADVPLMDVTINSVSYSCD